jgi:hypothetical protein
MRVIVRGVSFEERLGTRVQRRLGAETLAALGPTRRDDLLATNSRHTRTEAMAALTDQLARLIGTFHGKSPRIQSVAVWRGYIKKASTRVNRMGRLGRPQGAAYRVLFRRRIPLKTLFGVVF